MSAREQILLRVTELLDDRPVRWSDPGQFIGDYDGRERTLEVFNADAAEQRDLLRRMRPIREELEAVAGGPVVVVFHTRTESARLHAGFVVSYQDNAALRILAQQIRERLPEATVELTRTLESEKVGLTARLRSRSVIIGWNRQTGFEVWPIGEPGVDRDPDFRLSDGERVLLCVSMLLSAERKDASLADELGQFVSPERGTADTNASIEAPPVLDFEDQIVGKGTPLPPRRAA